MIKSKTAYVRNPVYVFYALGSLVIFLVVALVAGRPSLGLLERTMFDLFYRLPSFLTPFAIGLVVLGSIVAPLLLVVYFAVRRRGDIALRIAVVSILAFVLAQLTATWVQRPLPVEFIPGVTERGSLPITSFPSSYAAVSIAVGLMFAVYLPRVYRKWITLAFLLVGFAQLYLGVSLPLDVVAGWLIGLFAYSATSLALGSRFAPVRADKLAKKLTDAGLKGAKLKPASVDARGSVPFFGEYDGGKIFVKVFNQDNNAADWLFKMVRRVQYRRLEDEVPSLTPKRAIEHEAYVTMLATYKAKLRVPEFLGVYKVGNNSYAMALRRLDAEGLNTISSTKITDAMLAEVWRQIKLLHENRIIHKDLRCANVMIEKDTNLPWVIDFGFSESATSPKSFYKDNVEFIASSATKVGAKRAVGAALKALGTKGLNEALPYVQYAALSGATTTSLKSKPGLLQEIREEIMKQGGEEDTPKNVRLRRV